MAYCVRCGVELEKGCKACPLCKTEVLLPDENVSDEQDKTFSDHIPRYRRPRLNLAPSRSFLFLATFLIVVPLLVTLIVDFTYNRAITWSFYPITSLILLWVLIAYPAFLRGHTMLQVITVDIFAIAIFLISLDYYSGPSLSWSQYPFVSLLLLWVFIAGPLIFTWHHPIAVILFWLVGAAGFLFILDKMTDGRDWFLPLGLPIVILLTILGMLGIVLVRLAKKTPLLSIALSLFAAAVSITIIDVLVIFFVEQRFDLTWSPILSAVLVPTGIFLLIVNGSPELKAYLIKKFHL